GHGPDASDHGRHPYRTTVMGGRRQRQCGRLAPLRPFAVFRSGRPSRRPAAGHRRPDRSDDGERNGRHGGQPEPDPDADGDGAGRRLWRAPDQGCADRRRAPSGERLRLHPEPGAGIGRAAGAGHGALRQSADADLPMATLIRRGFAASTFVLTLALATGVASANDEPHWVAAYAFAPSAEMGPVGPASAPNPNDPRGPLGPETVQDVRLTHIVTVAASGRRVRLKLSNAHGAEPVRIGGLSIEHNGARHPARFDGTPSLVIPAGASWLSDPLDPTVEALDALAVSIDLPARTRPPTHRWRPTLTNPDGSTGH